MELIIDLKMENFMTSLINKTPNQLKREKKLFKKLSFEMDQV